MYIFNDIDWLTHVLFFFSIRINIVLSLSQNNINYFALNEANSPLAVLDLLETTMQIYHNYNRHNGGGTKNDTTSGFTTGVVLVTISEGDFDVFPPNRLRPAYSMQGTYPGNPPTTTIRYPFWTEQGRNNFSHPVNPTRIALL